MVKNNKDKSEEDLELQKLLQKAFEKIENNSKPCDPEIQKLISDNILELF